MNTNKGLEGFVLLAGIIAVIAMMLNPILTGWFLIKIIELIVILFVVNIATRAFTGKTLVQLLRSFGKEEKED